jgi:hypothetical protein
MPGLPTPIRLSTMRARKYSNQCIVAKGMPFEHGHVRITGLLMTRPRQFRKPLCGPWMGDAQQPASKLAHL